MAGEVYLAAMGPASGQSIVALGAGRTGDARNASGAVDIADVVWLSPMDERRVRPDVLDARVASLQLRTGMLARLSQ